MITMRTMLMSVTVVGVVVSVGSVMEAQNGVPMSPQIVLLTDPAASNNLNSATACTTPSSAAIGLKSYNVTLTAPKKLRILTRDLGCVGDYYRVSVNGEAFNTTPNPADYCGAEDSWGCATGTCATLSQAQKSACLPTGAYSVTVQDLGFAGHTAAEISGENMCPASWADAFLALGTSSCTCAEVQNGLILLVADESAFTGHGDYVSSAADTLNNLELQLGVSVSLECHDCIMSQFGQSVPQGQMVSCGTL